MKGKEMKDLGFANGWTDYPDEYKECKHRRLREVVGKCLTRVWCDECGFEFMVDSSD